MRYYQNNGCYHGYYKIAICNKKEYKQNLVIPIFYLPHPEWYYSPSDTTDDKFNKKGYTK